MKRIKSLKILMILSVLWQLFAACIPVYAAGTATIAFEGNSTVSVGETITIKMYIKNLSNVPGGVTALGGKLNFDDTYLEYVSGTGATSPYSFSMNNYKIAGMTIDSSVSIITGDTLIYTFNFKAKQTGTTQITLKDAIISDIDADKVTTTVNAKTITIGTASASKSSDATLKSLGATGYTLSPSFASGTTSYTVTVPSGTTSVTLTGAANDSKATVSGLGSVTLTGDTTTASVKVTAEDGTTKTYTVKIVKEKDEETGGETGGETTIKSSDATLKSLNASGYTLSPSFESGTTSYTVKVPKSATTIKLEGEVNHNKATVTGLGDIALDNDETTATIKVKAEDGTTKTYTVKIVKEDEKTEEKDSDATLKSLDMSGYTLNPTFNKDINTYSIKVKNSVTGLDVKAIPNSDKATVSISGNKGWQEGNNVVTIKVTAEDGSTNTYTINVTRESSGGNKEDTKSSDNYLSDLTIRSSHEIDKEFNKDISVYNITVPYEVDKLDLSTVTSNNKAKIKITGNNDFKVGEVNTVEIEVTAEDGSIRIYTLNVTRSTEGSDNELKDITIGGGVTLSPSFDPDILDYTTTVDGDTDKLDITAIPKSDGSTVEIIGNDNLKEGKNTVLIKVTDKEGFTKYYSIEVEKEAKEDTIFGLTHLQFGVIAGIIGLLSLLIIFLLLRKKKEDKKEERDYHTPIIEVKPEFNFGSKNTSDDDVVHGNLNQNSEVKEEKEYELPNYKTPAIEADYEENIPYDPYDETVTKREIIDAIHEATKTKDPSKLKMLLEQDALNQKKKELKKREELEKDSDEWR